MNKEITINEALNKGIVAHKAGQAKEASRYYTAILKVQPAHPEANHNMGVLAVGIGKVQEALPFFKTAVEANPNLNQYWLSYIDALIRLGRIDVAYEIFEQAKRYGLETENFSAIENMVTARINIVSRKETEEPTQDQLQLLLNLYYKGQYKKVLNKTSQLLERFSKSVILYNILGAANRSLGKLDKALEIYRKAISLKPDYADAHNNMGVTLKDQGKLEEAIAAYRKAVALKPDYAEAHNNIGVALKDQGKLEEAIVAYSKAISLKPDYAEAHNNIGVIFKDQGKLEEAIAAYSKAISLKPDYAEAHNNIGVIFKDQGKLEEAIAAYNKAISFKFYYAEFHNNRGAALQDQGKLEEAIEAYNKAIALKPDYADAFNNRGAALQDQGKLEEAIESYNKAISFKPYYAEVHRNLSSIKQYTKEDEHFIQVKEQYRIAALSEDERCNLSFALAKMYEDIGDLDQAFSHLYMGNALRKKLLNYSIKEDEKLFNNLKKTQPHLLKSSLEVKQVYSELSPVFIVGMPRSGTTLVEQIISSHSRVTGAGELNYVGQYGGELSINSKDANIESVSDFRKKYLLELSKVSKGASIVTDKMPQNFRFIPLICAAFPEAKIIHVQRNATATCWSNYKNYFVSKNLGYCCDKQDVVTYYFLYRDLMKLWQSKYSQRIYHLNYEHLIKYQEDQTRKLIKYLELNWEDVCLSPHQNKRSVRTASQQQVRQKIYMGSSQAWKKYEPYLNGVFDNLPS